MMTPASQRRLRRPISPSTFPALESLLMKRLFAAVALVLATGTTAFAAEPASIELFNGKDLTGWTQKNGTATYRVEDGAVVGKTSEGSPNSFLATNEEYANFELTFEVKVDDALNSGVQIRSRSLPDKDNGRVHGPQVEIATNGTAGFIYGEALGTGWLSDEKGEMTDETKKAAFKKGEWNKYRVVADGKSIKTWINGVPVADTLDEKSGHETGFIALQVHGIGKGQGPYEVRWRNIQLKKL